MYSRKHRFILALTAFKLRQMPAQSVDYRVCRSEFASEPRDYRVLSECLWHHCRGRWLRHLNFRTRRRNIYK
ncbi:hypothetical protein Hanom_Chr05g00404991 [Helianthus anomalus]